jgi:hypothetical protein
MKIAFSRPDGGVSIVVGAEKANLERLMGPLSDEQYKAFVWARCVPTDADDAIELPTDWEAPSDRSQRDAWRIRGGLVVIEG